MMNIRVENGKQSGFVGKDKIYIGRPNKYYNLPGNPLFNPYAISSTSSRDEVVSKFKQYLLIQLEEFKQGRDNAQVRELIRIYKLSLVSSITLTCWCKPLGCHGDVIVSTIKQLSTEDWFLKASVLNRDTHKE